MTNYYEAEKGDFGIYDLKLNDSLMLNENLSTSFSVMVQRVPMGWIYTTFDKGHGIQSSVFVPFNSEFNKK